jgi:hypothetical protein
MLGRGTGEEHIKRTSHDQYRIALSLIQLCLDAQVRVIVVLMLIIDCTLDYGR